jgi:hypothetical protein
MKKYKIVTTAGKYAFTGKHLKERETNNWHYYETDEGCIIHFRKEHMVMVFEYEEGQGVDSDAESQL